MTKIKNPILRGFNPDPSICRAGDDYYIATSTFEWYPGVQLSHSRDLVNWRNIGQALNRASQLDLRGNPDSGGVWAPSLTFADDKFWLIYTDVKRLDGSFKDAHNYLVTSNTIDGPWSDPIYLNSSGFDPSLFHDDDGRKWLMNMLWYHNAMMEDKHAHPSSYFGGILLQEYDGEKGELVGPVTNIFAGSELGLTEAPHLFKRDGYYYLTTAEGGTGYEHAITYARSKKLDGPYELHPHQHLLSVNDQPDSPLQRTGHGQYVDTPSGAYHTYLCTRPLPGTRKSPMGRETGIAKIEWDDDGWPYLPHHGLVPKVDVPGPDLPAHPFDPEPDSHDFTTLKQLPHCFMWPRTPDKGRIFNLTEDGLVLTGRESIGSWFEQALVARRQTEWNCEAETELVFMPENSQQMAGLVAYYNRTQFHYLAVTRAPNSGRRVLNMLSCDDWPESRLTFPLDGMVEVQEDTPLRLGLKLTEGKLQFCYASGDEAFQPIGPALDAHILSDEGVRGEHFTFTGTFIGMAAQDVSGCAKRAIFRSFKLKNLT